MLVLIIFAFLPFIELMVFVAVGSKIGFFVALLVLLGMAILGGFIINQQGLNTMMNAQRSLREGKFPSHDIFDSLLIALAGGLMIMPGFMTDILGLLLLIPAVRNTLRERISRNARFQTMSFSMDGFSAENADIRDNNAIDVNFKTISEQEKP